MHIRRGMAAATLSAVLATVGTATTASAAEKPPKPAKPVASAKVPEVAELKASFHDGCYDEDEVEAYVDTSQDPGEMAEVFALMDPPLC